MHIIVFNTQDSRRTCTHFPKTCAMCGLSPSSFDPGLLPGENAKTHRTDELDTFFYRHVRSLFSLDYFLRESSLAEVNTLDLDLAGVLSLLRVGDGKTFTYE